MSEASAVQVLDALTIGTGQIWLDFEKFNFPEIIILVKTIKLFNFSNNLIIQSQINALILTYYTIKKIWDLVKQRQCVNRAYIYMGKL